MELNRNRALIKAAIEADINKRASLSLFDRFGQESSVFQLQFQAAKQCIKKAKACQERQQAHETFISVDNILKAKKQELALLKQFDKGKLSQIEQILDDVSDLKEEICSDIDQLESRLEDGNVLTREPRGSNDPDGDVCEQLTEWRLQTLPPIPKSY